MSFNRLTRRQLLKQASAVLASGGALTLLRAQPNTSVVPVPPSNDPKVLTGIVERTTQAQELQIRSEQGLKIAKFSGHARMSRGHSGRVPSTTAFIPTDEVVVEGEVSAGVITATVLTSMYRIIEAHILDRQGNQLHTTEGMLRLSADTHSQDSIPFRAKPLADIIIGDHVKVLAWYDPSAEVLTALKIAVLEDHH